MSTTPPHDTNAETAVLGAMIFDPACIPIVSGIVRREDFYVPAHGTVFEAIVLVERKGWHVDITTVADQLRAMPSGHPNDDRTIPRLNTVGGAQYIAELHEGVFTSAGVENRAQIVAEHAARRRYIESASEGIRRAHECAPLGTLASIAAKVADAAAGVHAPEASDLGGALDEFGALIADGRPDRLTTTGFLDLDRIFDGGWRDGELIIDAARPGVGKTAKALRHARQAAVAGPVAFVSLEMPRAQLTTRLMSAESGVPLSRIRTREFLPDDIPAMTEAAKRIHALNLALYDLKALAGGRGRRPTLATLRALLLRERAKKGRHALAVVDYLQLVRADRDREKREQEVSEVARGLKELALELETPILALAQLNRAIEKRGEDSEPEMSDLRESGEIEQAADAVCFLARPKSAPGVLRVYVKKQRNGPTGVVDLQWASETTKPGDLARGYDDTNVVEMHRGGRRAAQPERDPGFTYDPEGTNDDF